jgi:hypothetical protein
MVRRRVWRSLFIPPHFAVPREYVVSITYVNVVYTAVIVQMLFL